MRAAVQMLDHIDEPAAAQRLRAAVQQVYSEGKSLTRDVGGTASTSTFADAIVAAIG
jgi:isocitrate dehydrogenase (NAD+)